MRARVFTLLSAVLLLLVSCTDQSVPETFNYRPVAYQIRISEDSQDYFDIGLKFSKEAASESITFKATAPWSSSFADASASEWVEISPASGEAGNMEMNISVPANAGGVRTTTLVLQCGAVKKRLTIFQDGLAVDPNKVESVSLNKTELTMAPGDVEELVATVLPATAPQTVTWSVSDDTVLLVDNGVVIALKEGIATVTAKAADKTATCQVTVKAEEPVNPVDPDDPVDPVDPDPPYEFTLSLNAVEMAAEGGTFEITVTCSGNYHISGMPDWVTDITPDGNGTTHVFRVAANPDTEQRTGAVTFCDEAGTCLSCMVTQAPAPAPPGDPSEGDNEDYDDGDPITW